MFSEWSVKGIRSGLRTVGQEIPVARGRASPHVSCEHLQMQPLIAPERVRGPAGDAVGEVDRPWLVIVWNDPINLMSYVTWVFQKLFGYSRKKATRLMLDVHHKGRAVVSSGPQEKAEMDCFRLHAHGLWATISRSD